MGHRGGRRAPGAKRRKRQKIGGIAGGGDSSKMSSKLGPEKSGVSLKEKGGNFRDGREGNLIQKGGESKKFRCNSFLKIGVGPSGRGRNLLTRGRA